jgi:hypothetical protein
MDPVCERTVAAEVRYEEEMRSARVRKDISQEEQEPTEPAEYGSRTAKVGLITLQRKSY